MFFAKVILRLITFALSLIKSNEIFNIGLIFFDFTPTCIVCYVNILEIRVFHLFHVRYASSNSIMSVIQYHVDCQFLFYLSISVSYLSFSAYQRVFISQVWVKCAGARFSRYRVCNTRFTDISCILISSVTRQFHA